MGDKGRGRSQKYQKMSDIIYGWPLYKIFLNQKMILFTILFYFRFVFRHKQQVHDKILPHICHVCGKGFFTAFMMKNHTANVHNSDAKSFVCERCGKSFPSR